MKYKGTSKSSEGYAASITFQMAKDEGMQIAVHWRDADSSSANAVREVFPDADIMICGGHAGHAHKKTPKNALGIEAVSAPAFMDTIYSMYPIVKAMLDDICETAKQEMKDKREDELGSWQSAVTVADGTWQTRGWHSKNATFTIRSYLNGGLLYYHHLCQEGRDEVIEEVEILRGVRRNPPRGMPLVLHFRGPKMRECRLLYTGRTQTLLLPMPSERSFLMPT